MRPWKLKECSDDIKRQIALQDRVAVSVADVEPAARRKQMAAKKNPRLDSPGGFVIRINSRRIRLADSDGVSAKACIDGLVLAGILSDDRPEIVRSVEYDQEKSKTEETIIEIYEAT